MSEIPGDLKFLKSHEWARVEGNGRVTVGIPTMPRACWVTWSTSNCRKSAPTPRPANRSPSSSR